MATTDSKGIIRYEAGDSVYPLHTALNLGLDSVSTALDSPLYNTPAGVHVVANSTELAPLRTTMTNAGYPTTEPLYAHRKDNGELYVQKTSSGSWESLSAPDTGWQRLTPASGYKNATGSTEAQYRHKDGVVYLRGTLTKTSGTIGANETVTTVPAQFAPDRYMGFPLVTPTPANGIRGRVNTAGQIGTQNGTTLGSAITLDGVFWVL